MAWNWIRVRSAWHLIGRVDASGWYTACREFAPGEAAVSDTLPEGELPCPACDLVKRREDRIAKLDEAETSDVEGSPL
jgi:hypothetical protein